MEMRTNGMAIYFRYKNEEYVLMSRYNQISFLSNDGIIETQSNNYILKLKVTDNKGHQKFIKAFYESRNLFMKSY